VIYAFLRLSDPDDGSAMYLRADRVAIVLEVPAREPFAAAATFYGSAIPPKPGRPRHALIRMTDGATLKTRETPEEIFEQLQEFAVRAGEAA
jgi:hypothetical protein